MGRKRAASYRRPDLSERKRIEEALKRRCSIREMAGMLERSPSTIPREIQREREVAGGKHAGELASEVGAPRTSCPVRDAPPFC